MDVLVVGIDAGCEEVLEREFDAGRLPVLKQLFDDGVSGPLESHMPPWTPSMWPSIYTGVNPGKHGIYSFLSYDGYDWDIVNATHRRERPLWSLLDDQGLSSVIVNVPVTHPSGDFDGALIPGYTAPENPTCTPEGVLSEVEDAIGRDYRIYPDFENGAGDPIDEYRHLVRLRGDAFRYLCDSRDPEFGFVQFQVTDTVFHKHPGRLDMVSDIYEAVDEEVESVLEEYDPDVTLVVSDHGMGKYEGYGFRLNTFLEEHGYVESTYGGGGMPTWALERDDTLSNGEERAEDGLAEEFAEWGLEAAASVGVTTSRVGNALERVGLRDAVAQAVPDRIIRAGQRQVDFENSIAYMRNRIEVGVRINLEGRDPAGKVPQSEYESVRTELIELLSGVETPDGEPVFEEVVRREEYFQGPTVDQAVDIITVPADFDHFVSADLLDDVFGEPGQPWNHKRYGIVAVDGEDVDTEASVEGAHLFDVAPSVLAALGQAKSDRMDGDVLDPLPEVGVRQYADQEDHDDSRTEDPEMVDRLRELGYMDQ